MDFLTLAIIFLLGLFAVALLNFNLRNSDLPPGPYGLPFVGYSPFLGSNVARTLQNLGRKYGNVICVSLGNRPVIILNGWDAIKEAVGPQGDIFSGRTKTYINKVFSNDYTDIVFNDGIIWKEQKRFSLHTLRDLGFGRTAFESVIMTEVDKLTEYLNSQDGLPVDMSHVFFVYVTNIIFGIAAGRRFNNNDKEISFFRDIFKYISVPKYSIINFLPFLRFFAPQKISYNKFGKQISMIRAFLAETIDEHEREFKENNLRDFIDHYLAKIKRRKKDGTETPPFTKKHLAGIVFDLFFAGVDTSENTLLWSVLYMTLHQDIQKKIQHELDKVIANDSFLSTSSKSMVPYAQATIFEIQRHASVAPMGAPHRTTADTTILGHKLPKNICVFFNLYSIHHDEHYWGDPEIFRPERFLDDSGNLIKPERLLPLGAGPRACLGESLAKMELFIFVTCLLRRFSFHPIPGQPLPSTVPQSGTAIIKPKQFSVIVKRRN